MTDVLRKARCLDCLHLWLPGDELGACPECGSDQVLGIGRPWCWMQPRSVLYIQHRLARYTDAEIAARYGVSRGAVRWALSKGLRIIRHRSRLRCHDVTDMLLIAQADGLPLMALVTPVSNSADAADAQRPVA